MSMMLPEEPNDRNRPPRTSDTSSFSRPSEMAADALARPYFVATAQVSQTGAARFLDGLCLPDLQPAYLRGDREFVARSATMYAKLGESAENGIATIDDLRKRIRGYVQIVSGGIQGGLGHVKKWVVGSAIFVRNILIQGSKDPVQVVLDQSWDRLNMYSKWLGARSLASGNDLSVAPPESKSTVQQSRFIRTWRLAEHTASFGVEVLDRKNASGRFSVHEGTAMAIFYAVQSFKDLWEHALLREFAIVASLNSEVGGPTEPIFEDCNFHQRVRDGSPDIQAKFTSGDGHLTVELTMPVYRRIRPHVVESLTTGLPQTYLGYLSEAVKSVGGHLMSNGPVISLIDGSANYDRLMVKFSVPEKRSNVGKSRDSEKDRKLNEALCGMGRELHPTLPDFVQITISLHNAPIIIERDSLLDIQSGFYLQEAKKFADENPSVRSVSVLSNGPNNFPTFLINAPNPSEILTRPAKYHQLCAKLICEDRVEEAIRASAMDPTKGTQIEFSDLRDPEIAGRLGRLLGLTNGNLEICPTLFGQMQPKAFEEFADIFCKKAVEIQRKCGLLLSGCRLVVPYELNSETDDQGIDKIRFYVIPPGGEKRIWGEYSVSGEKTGLSLNFDETKISVPEEACNTLRYIITEKNDGSRLAELTLPRKLLTWLRSLSVLDDLSDENLRHELALRMLELGYECRITDVGDIEIYKTT